MVKVTLALGSFVLGALSMLFLLSDVHASTVTQSGVGNGSIPILPPLSGTKLNRLGLGGGRWTLDGIDCDSCTFRDLNLEYSGGLVRCENCSFDGDVTLSLKGAALDGWFVTQWFIALEKNNPSLFKTAPPTLRYAMKNPSPANLDIPPKQESGD
jgi:hypothetical protein